MALPAAVQRQIQEAEEIAKALYGEEAIAAREAAERGEQPPAEPEAPAAPAAPAAPEDAGWQHKYNVLQGKYNAEVPRLNTTVREQASSIAQLTQQIETLRAEVERLKSPRPSPITAQEVEDYTPELLDVVSRQAREVVAPDLATVRAEVDQIKDRLASVSKVVVENKQERVLRLLDQRVENWQEQNLDEGFAAWLDDVDPLSGQVRREMLNKAFSSGNGESVVAFFNAYRNEHAATQPPVQGSQQGSPTVDMREFTAPGRAAPSAPQGGAQTEKRIWTAALIEKLYADARRGVYRGREAEFRALELDIVAAEREGRIR